MSWQTQRAYNFQNSSTNGNAITFSFDFNSNERQKRGWKQRKSRALAIEFLCQIALECSHLPQMFEMSGIISNKRSTMLAWLFYMILSESRCSSLLSNICVWMNKKSLPHFLVIFYETHVKTPTGDCWWNANVCAARENNCVAVE